MKKNTDRDLGAFLPIYTQASPSLALVKYWGKARGSASMPATTSLAVTLEGLMTTTILAPSSLRDEVFVHGASENYDRYKAVFQGARKISALPKAVEAWSWNSFPTGAGIASSSSGFAALALGLLCMGRHATESARVDGISSWSALLHDKSFLKSASRLACRGSVSASRAVYGGFTLLVRNKDYAIQLEKATYWDNLRILVIVVSEKTKDISSRNGMKITQATSPFYKAWLNDAVKLSKEALDAFANKDLEKLGHCMRASYMRMHASAMASQEPLLYWKPESLAVLTICEELRKEGFSVWETMDAGPQVKLLYEEHEEERLLARLNILINDQCGAFANRPLYIHARPGGDPLLRTITNEEFRTFRKKEAPITRSL